MTRRFAESLVKCASLEEVLGLVDGRPQDAIAFTNFCMAWVDHEEVKAWEWTKPKDAPYPELTACGYFALDVLRAIEAAYPEGLTEIPEE